MKFLLADLSGVFRMNYHATEDEPVGSGLSKTLSRIRGLAEGYDRVAI